MADIEDDLNKTIRSAVNARVEAAVMAALSGDEVIGAMVAAALQQQVEVPSERGYGKEKVPFMVHAVRSAIRSATKDAVAKVITEETPLIEDEVRKAFKRSAATLADSLVSSLAESCRSAYGVSVELRLPRSDG